MYIGKSITSVRMWNPDMVWYGLEEGEGRRWVPGWVHEGVDAQVVASKFARVLRKFDVEVRVEGGEVVTGECVDVNSLEREFLRMKDNMDKSKGKGSKKNIDSLKRLAKMMIRA